MANIRTLFVNSVSIAEFLRSSETDLYNAKKGREISAPAKVSEYIEKKRALAKEDRPKKNQDGKGPEGEKENPQEKTISKLANAARDLLGFARSSFRDASGLDLPVDAVLGKPNQPTYSHVLLGISALAHKLAECANYMIKLDIC